MAKYIGPVDEPEDTFEHAKISGNGDEQVDKKGVSLSKHRVYEYQRNADGDAALRIPADSILEWAENLRKLGLTREEKRGRSRPEVCYEGTDTIDGEHSEFREKRNHFDLDKSKSTVLITVANSNDTWLNGSAIPHRKFIRISLKLPDGRYYGSFEMSFDQFATALVLPTETPCTWDRYMDVNEHNVWMSEVVNPPQPIKERMADRLVSQLDDVDNKFEEAMTKLREQIDTGKAMSKTKLIDLLRDLEIVKCHADSNRDFVVDQALEETAKIVEGAAITIAMEHGIRPKQISEGRVVKSLLEHKKELDEEQADNTRITEAPSESSPDS